MAEPSFTARLLAALLLLALFMAAWRFLQPPAQPQSPPPSKKRSSKKKKKKKDKKPAAPKPSTRTPETPEPQAKPQAEPKSEQVDGSDDSDSDDGLTAAQVLAQRTFAPKALGGRRLARQIQASLPPADAPRFTVGQEVLARFDRGQRYFPATVLEVRKGNAYHLRYDDGEVEYRVPAALIKSATPEDAPEAPTAATSADVVQDVDSSSSSEGEAEDDGWEVVGVPTRRRAPPTTLETQDPSSAGGLTKRQRESRRKRERKREMKELARLQAQQGEIDARARMRYVPPPSTTSS